MRWSLKLPHRIASVRTARLAQLTAGGLLIVGVLRLFVGLARANARRARAEEEAGRLRALLPQAEQLAVAHERARLARELHDGLGHHLHTARIYLAAALRAAAAGQARPALEIAQAELRSAQAELRRALDAAPAEAAAARPIEELLAGPIRSGQLAGIALALRVDGAARPLSAQVRHALLRIAQEAITNMSKHAQASHGLVELHYADTLVRLTISDDGVGFTVGQAHAGHGLASMRERAGLLGGQLQILSRPGGGCRLVVEVPYEACSG